MIAVLVYVYAFPAWDRTYLLVFLAVGWIVAEVAGALWVKKRRERKGK